MGGACRTLGTYNGNTYPYKVFVGKSEGTTPFGRPRLRGEDNIRMHLMEIGWKGVE